MQYDMKGIWRMIRNETGYEKYIYMRMIRICNVICVICILYRSVVTLNRGHIPTKRKA